MLQLLKRTLNGDLLNAVANDPDVRPWLGGEGEIDLRPLIEDPANIALVNDHGGFVAVRQEPAIYDIHTLFRKAGRGRGLVAAAHEGYRYMFAATDCIELQTIVPEGNRGAAMLSTAVGFRPVFERPCAWRGPDGEAQNVSYRALSFDAWRAQDDTIETAGHWFRKALEAVKPQPPLADDPAQDRAMGAALLMAQAGNQRKAVWLYNRFARQAALPTMTMVSETPVVIDMPAGAATARVESCGVSMEVLSCR